MCNRYYPKTGNTYGSLDPRSPLSGTHTYLNASFRTDEKKRTRGTRQANSQWVRSATTLRRVKGAALNQSTQGLRRLYPPFPSPACSSTSQEPVLAAVRRKTDKYSLRSPRTTLLTTQTYSPKLISKS